MYVRNAYTIGSVIHSKDWENKTNKIFINYIFIEQKASKTFQVKWWTVVVYLTDLHQRKDMREFHWLSKTVWFCLAQRPLNELLYHFYISVNIFFAVEILLNTFKILLKDFTVANGDI